MVAGAGVGGHTQLAYPGKGEDGVVQEAAVGEEGEEGVDDGRQGAAAWPECESRAVEEVDEGGGEVGVVTGGEEAGEEASGMGKEAGAGEDVGGEAEVGGGGEGVGEEVVGGDGLERVQETEAVGDGSGGGGAGWEGGDGRGGDTEGDESRVPARADEEEVAAQGEG